MKFSIGKFSIVKFSIGLAAGLVVLGFACGTAVAGNSTINYADGTKAQVITSPTGTIVLQFDRKGARVGKQTLPDAGAAAHLGVVQRLSKPGSSVVHNPE